MQVTTRDSDEAAGERLGALGRARTRVGMMLTAGVVAIYFGFIFAVAFAKPWLGRQIAPGLSIGILFGAGVIVSAWLLTWVYVRWANTHYDTAVRALRDGSFHRGDAETRR